MRIVLTLIAIWLGTVCAVAVQAQAPADPAMRIWSGVFTAAQASRGDQAYAACTNCHSADLSGGAGPALAGPRFIEKWQGESLTRLFRTIRDTMPRNDPGRLTDQAAVDLVAYILQANQFPAGMTELAPTADALAAVTLVPKTGPVARAVPNFALVQVVGCLQDSGRGGWTLEQASTPVATKNVPATGADLEAAGAQAGTESYRLISVLPFDPGPHRGHKMFVKGLLNRAPDGILLNVTALEMVSVGCAP